MLDATEWIVAPTETISIPGPTTIHQRVTNHGVVHGPTSTDDFLIFGDNVEGAGGYTGNIQFNQVYSPGNSPGVVPVENVVFTQTSTLVIELAGTDLGEFDRLEISGDAQLNGSVVVMLLAPFTPSVGDEFEILNVAGSLSGEFIGLGEGALLTAVGGWQFQISYTGGDGNDVVLTAVPEPSGLGLFVLTILGLGIRRHGNRRQLRSKHSLLALHRG